MYTAMFPFGVIPLGSALGWLLVAIAVLGLLVWAWLVSAPVRVSHQVPVVQPLSGLPEARAFAQFLSTILATRAPEEGRRMVEQLQREYPDYVWTVDSARRGIQVSERWRPAPTKAEALVGDARVLRTHLRAVVQEGRERRLGVAAPGARS